MRKAVPLTTSVLVAVLGGAMLGPSPAAAFHDATLRVEGWAWFPSLSAKARSTKNGIAGDEISDKDLGIGDPGAVPGGSGTLRVGPHTLRVEGFSLSADGDTQISRSFTFSGRTYTVNSEVISEAKLKVFAADYGFDVVHTPPLALALTLGVRYGSADFRLRAPALGFDQKESFEGPAPAVGVTLIAHPFLVPFLSSLAVIGRASGGTIGDRATYYDVDAGVEWLPLPLLAVRAGYRYVHADGKDGGNRAKFDLSGPYIGASLSF